MLHQSMSAFLSNHYCYSVSFLVSHVRSPGTGPSAANKLANSSSGGALYPNLLVDYSVINLPGEDQQDLSKLIPMAQQLAATVSKCKLQLEPSICIGMRLD